MQKKNDRYNESSPTNVDAYHWSVADSGVLIVIIMIKVISCFHNRETIKFRLTFFRVLYLCGARSNSRMHLLLYVVLFTVIFIAIFIILSLKLKAPVNNCCNNNNKNKILYTFVHTFLDCLTVTADVQCYCRKLRLMAWEKELTFL